MNRHRKNKKREEKLVMSRQVIYVPKGNELCLVWFQQKILAATRCKNKNIILQYDQEIPLSSPSRERIEPRSWLLLDLIVIAEVPSRSSNLVFIIKIAQKLVWVIDDLTFMLYRATLDWTCKNKIFKSYCFHFQHILASTLTSTGIFWRNWIVHHVPIYIPF